MRSPFGASPVAVGRASSVAEPMAFFTHDATGVPVLVTRDRGGRVHAMVNRCRHRDVRLVLEARGTAESFVCWQHAWTYDLCGRLGTLPVSRCAEGQARGEGALVELPSEVRHGFVWVATAPRAAIDVAAWLGDLDGDLAGLGLERLVVIDELTTSGDARDRRALDAFAAGSAAGALAAYVDDGSPIEASGPHARAIAWDATRYALAPNAILAARADGVTYVALFPRADGGVDRVETLLGAP